MRTEHCCYRALSSLASLLVLVVCVHSFRGRGIADPDALQYLNDVFQHVKDSGRQPSTSGEYNLLPDESQGFANMVQCLSEHSDPGYENTGAILPHQLSSNQRRLFFNLSHIKDTDKIILMKLIIKKPAHMPRLQLKLYTVTNQGKIILGNTKFSGNDWIHLDVDISGQPLTGLLQLILEDSKDDTGARFLNAFSPKLLFYSYNSNLLQGLFRASSAPSQEPTVESASVEANTVVRKRRNEEQMGRKADTLEKKSKRFCSKYTENLTYQQLGWPVGITVIRPATLHFSYCYGHCGRIDAQTASKFSRHSKYVFNSARHLVDAGVLPCCVPTTLVPIQLEFYEDGVSKMIVIEDVVECGCL